MMRISAFVVMFKGQTVRGINSSLATEGHLHTSRACSTRHDQEFGYKEWTLDRGRTGWIAAIVEPTLRRLCGAGGVLDEAEQKIVMAFGHT